MIGGDEAKPRLYNMAQKVERLAEKLQDDYPESASASDA